MPNMINLLWDGPFYGSTSVAKLNREIVERLRQGCRIDLTLLPFQLDPSGQGTETGDPLSFLDIRQKGLNPHQLIELPSVCVRNRWPVQKQAPPSRLKWVIFLPWEYSVLPTETSETMRRADQVWTTSQFCRDSFIRSGLDPERISVVPLGVDSGIYSPEGSPFSIATEKGFRFLFVGGTIFRKGTDVLLEAYRRAFSPSDDVCLVIKDFGADSIYAGQTNELLFQAFQAEPCNPALIYLRANLIEAELAALYRSCNVFVSSYRGEGFALPVLEAMACGLPVIVTGQGSTDDFCDERVGWKINSSWKSVGSRIYGQPAVGESFLLEPEVDHLSTLMRACYESHDAVNKKGLEAARKARQWTWERSAAIVSLELERLTGKKLSQD